MAELPPNTYMPQDPSMEAGLAPMQPNMAQPPQGGSEKTAIAFIESAAEMLQAAADEFPALAPAVEQIKAFIGEALSGNLQSEGQGQPPMQESPSAMGGSPTFPPEMF